jgi:hypothetical protein
MPLERLSGYFRAGLRHFVSDHIAVDIQRGVDVGVPHQFLLHGNWKSQGKSATITA